MERPKMYQNKENKVFHNNREVFMSTDKHYVDKVLDTNDVRKKIMDIIDSNNFIYSKAVNIVIGGQIIVRKIIGIRNNDLITIDNEYIPIDNISDVYK